MNLFKQTKKAVIVALLLTFSALNAPLNAELDDHVVVVSSPQTVEQILQMELQSVKFAEQIALYNGVPSATTVLPAGTKLSIPKPYLDLVKSGRIAYVKGDVTHLRSDIVVNPPARGSSIRVGDVIKTGEDGFVSLSFNRGARVHVQPGSQIKVNKVDCLKAELDCIIALFADAGQVASEVTPRVEGESQVKFSIDTPFLTAAVRGTAFYVDIDEGNNRLGVTKGLVATEVGDQTDELPRGKGITVSEGAPPVKVDLLDPPVLSLTGEKILLSSEDKISWLALNGAMNYRADFATDETMSERVVSDTTSERQFDTPELSPGDYFLTLAGIDENKFVGLPVKKEVAIAEITREAPALEITRDNGVTILSLPSHDGRAQLLISKSIDADPLIRELANGSDQHTLVFEPDSEWVFRVRSILGPHAVSAYSEFHKAGNQ